MDWLLLLGHPRFRLPFSSTRGGRPDRWELSTDQGHPEDDGSEARQRQTAVLADPSRPATFRRSDFPSSSSQLS